MPPATPVRAESIMAIRKNFIPSVWDGDPLTVQLIVAQMVYVQRNAWLRLSCIPSTGPPPVRAHGFSFTEKERV